MSALPPIKCLHAVPVPRKRVLFLGYERSQTRLIDLLASKNCHVEHTDAPVEQVSGYELIVSFGYRHILRKAAIDSAACPILNLHIAWLPYNRGAHPAFWAFYDGTPSGVTIHQIDEGLDTGDIAYQTVVDIDPYQNTFSAAHRQLIEAIENLFEAHVDDILDGQWVPKAQTGAGTAHHTRDLPADFAGWETLIAPEIVRLKQHRLNEESRYEHS